MRTLRFLIAPVAITAAVLFFAGAYGSAQAAASKNASLVLDRGWEFRQAPA